MAATLQAAAPNPRSHESFDTIVVGAGAAGSVLAARLSEDPGVRVLVLEAGGPDDDPRIHQPSAFRQLLGTPADWAFTTEPEAQLNGRRVDWPRGRVWGGSGSLSAMVYVRGPRRDFDRWEDEGNPGWGYDDLLPYFKKAEDQERGSSEHHGTGGPQSVTDPRFVPALSAAFVVAATQVGIPRDDDFNDATLEGVGLFQLNQKAGERHSTADAYLRPALGRGNLRVESHALVTRVLFEERRAVGVAYVQDGVAHEARAREVILSAGAIGSPQLLMLSGVGPADELVALGLPVVADLPGVGQNLQDHPRVALTYAARPDAAAPDANAEQAARRQYAEDRRGPLSSNGVAAGAFVRLEPQAPAPEIKIFATGPPAGGFSLHVALLHPRSRGAVRLGSSDPTAPPAIQAGYLQDARDLEQLVEGLVIARRIALAPALTAHRGEELGPGPDGWEPAALERYVRDNLTTFFHAVGTCRMGTDSLAVVDARLRVRGVEGLRVVDASVMPTLIAGATHAATVAIAEKAADLIKQDREAPRRGGRGLASCR